MCFDDIGSQINSLKPFNIYPKPGCYNSSPLKRTQRPRCTSRSLPMLVCTHTELHTHLGSALIPHEIPDRPWLMGLQCPLTRPVGLIPCNRRCINILEAQKSFLLTMQSPHNIFPCFGFTSTISWITSDRSLSLSQLHVKHASCWSFFYMCGQKCKCTLVT